VNTAGLQPCPASATIDSGEAVETRTRRYCAGSPTRRSKVDHGPSLPSLCGRTLLSVMMHCRWMRQSMAGQSVQMLACWNHKWLWRRSIVGQTAGDKGCAGPDPRGSHRECPLRDNSSVAHKVGIHSSQTRARLPMSLSITTIDKDSTSKDSMANEAPEYGYSSERDATSSVSISCTAGRS
jgi:hypothetical protein